MNKTVDSIIKSYMFANANNDYDIGKYGLIHRMKHNRIIYLQGACCHGNMKLIKKITKIPPKKHGYDHVLLNYSLRDAFNVEIIEYLLKLGADDLYEAMAGACRRGNLEIINYVLNKGLKFNSYHLLLASKGGNTTIVKMILDAGVVDLNSGLYGAAEGGHVELVKMFISKGATNFMEALTSACRHNKLDVANILIEYVDNINDCFFSVNSVELYNLFIKHGATEIEQCLHSACSYRNIELVKLIIDKIPNNITKNVLNACYREMMSNAHDLGEDYEILKLLIDKYTSVLIKKN